MGATTALDPHVELTWKLGTKPAITLHRYGHIALEGGYHAACERLAKMGFKVTGQLAR